VNARSAKVYFIPRALIVPCKQKIKLVSMKTEKDVALSFSTNSSDVIMEFLKSNEFQDIVINAVSVETEKL
jgi:hypothetical protein